MVPLLLDRPCELAPSIPCPVVDRSKIAAAKARRRQWDFSQIGDESIDTGISELLSRRLAEPVNVSEALPGKSADFVTIDREALFRACLERFREEGNSSFVRIPCYTDWVHELTDRSAQGEPDVSVFRNRSRTYGIPALFGRVLVVGSVAAVSFSDTPGIRIYRIS